MVRFIAARRLAADQAIAVVPFWSPVQAAFLCEELAEDADWAEVVDGLNVLLHDQRGD